MKSLKMNMVTNELLRLRENVGCQIVRSFRSNCSSCGVLHNFYIEQLKYIFGDSDFHIDNVFDLNKAEIG
jgi:hypothetical protein